MSQEQNQGWANAAPFAILSVAVLIACLGGFRAGFIPASSAPLMVGVLISCFLPQLIGGIIAFKRGEVLLGTICGLFGTTITLGAAFTLWIQIFAAPAPGAFTPQIMAFFWITLFIITEIFAIGFGRMSWFLMLGIAEVGVVFLLEGIYSYQGAPIGPNGYIISGLGNLAGYLELLFGLFCIYSAGGILLAEHFQRPVLPLGKPVFK